MEINKGMDYLHGSNLDFPCPIMGIQEPTPVRETQTKNPLHRSGLFSLWRGVFTGGNDFVT